MDPDAPLLVHRDLRDLADDSSPYLQEVAAEYAYATAYLAGDHDVARDIVDDWCSEYPNNPRAAVAALTMATEDKDVAKMADMAAETSAHFPEEAELQLKCSRFLEKAGRWSDAIVSLKRSGVSDAEAPDEDGIRIQLALAALSIKLGDSQADEEAVKILDRLADCELPEDLQLSYAYITALALGVNGHLDDARKILSDRVIRGFEGAGSRAGPDRWHPLAKRQRHRRPVCRYHLCATPYVSCRGGSQRDLPAHC